MSSLCFSFLQLKVLDSFIGVKLSLIKFFVPSLNLCYFYYFASFFLFSKIWLQLFLLIKVTIVFFDSNLTSALPNLWQAPMSFFFILFFICSLNYYEWNQVFHLEECYFSFHTEWENFAPFSLQFVKFLLQILFHLANIWLPCNVVFKTINNILS